MTARILLIIGGGIAAYKTPALVRALRADGWEVRCVLTAAGAQFVSPLALASVSGDKVYENLFDLTDEAEMGHIRLSRAADLILVAPATADLIAKMAQGAANDLASTLLLAADKPIMVAPAMNVRMWENAATQRNLAQLKADGVVVLDPDEGEMACGETGTGRMREPAEIAAACSPFLPTGDDARPLAGKRILITAGPTFEPLDPVRFIANRSSGKQGYAIAAAAAEAGGDVVLVSGPTALPDPPDMRVVRVETARDMAAAVEASLPVDVAVMTAAVADWRPAETASRKLKKRDKEHGTLALAENPDILATLCADARRPSLVIGFAAETDDVICAAEAKRRRKGCDWIVANDVAALQSDAHGVMGGGRNTVHVLDETGCEDWPEMSKAEVGERLAGRIADALAAPDVAKVGT